MAARTMTIDQALKITKGLFELTQARGDGSLKFIFLQSSREKIGELFGEYYTEATNDLDTLIRILSDYVNKFPRVTGSSTFSKFDTNHDKKLSWDEICEAFNDANINGVKLPCQ